MTHFRLLVTGSREWDHPDSVDQVLAHYTREAFSLGGSLVVVHGKAAKGGDDLAAAWVKIRTRNGWPVTQDPHPAHWSAPCPDTCQPDHRQHDGGREWCPMAGHRRNQQMVDLGAAACVGFHRNGSSGTRDCLQRAKEAGIPRLRITWPMRDQVDPQWLFEHAPGLVAV